MAGVFSNTPPEDDKEATSSGMRVAGALAGEGDEEVPEEAPQPQQPQGTVDGSAQAYLAPTESEEEPAAAQGDVPVSADTKAYMTPIAPPTLGKPAAFADHSANRDAMTAQKEAEAKENTKPSIGRKILAALSAGAAGFASRDSGVGARLGQEIMGGPLADAQARWATQEAPIQARINADQAADAATARANAVTEQQNRLAETNYSNQIRGQQDAARAENYQAQAEARRNAITAFTPDDPANPYAGGTGTTADGRTIKGVPPPDKWLANWEKNPDNVAKAQAHKGIVMLKAMKDAGIKLTSEQEAIVGSGGKVTPAVHTNISILENPDGSARTPAGQAGPSEVIAKSMQDKDTFASQWKRVGKEDATEFTPEGSYVNVDDPGKVMNPQEFNAKIEKFRTDLNANPVMRKSGTMVDPKGNTVTGRFSRNPQQQAALPQQQPSPAVQPQQPAPKPPRTPATGLPDKTAARNPRTGQVEWIVKGGKWTPAQP